MAKSRKNQKSHGTVFNNATINPDRKKWHKRDNTRSTYPNNTGNFYLPGGVAPPVYLPSLDQEAAAGGRVGGVGGMGGVGGCAGPVNTHGNAFGYPPYYYPGGDPWGMSRYYGMTGASMNASANAMVAQIEDLKDQEKRLFLEEFRYPGQQAQYQAPCCDHRFAEPVPGMGIGMEAVNAGMAATAGGNCMASKLRGDAPEFVPKKSSTPESDRQSSGWTIVTSWY